MKKYKNILRRLDELEARIGKVENRCKAMDGISRMLGAEMINIREELRIANATWMKNQDEHIERMNNEKV